jgi:hypothetical protein
MVISAATRLHCQQIARGTAVYSGRPGYDDALFLLTREKSTGKPTGSLSDKRLFPCDAAQDRN